MSSKRITYIENVLHWLEGVQYPVSPTECFVFAQVTCPVIVIVTSLPASVVSCVCLSKGLTLFVHLLLFQLFYQAFHECFISTTF